QGVVHAAAGGVAAGHGVVDLDRLARGRVQRHLEGARADRLGGRGGRLVEPDGRGRVVVGDRGRVLLGRAQGGIVRVGQLDLHGLVELVQRVVHDRGRDVLGGVTRGEGQRGRGHGVVHAAAGGVAAGHGVVDLDRLARGRVQRHLEGARADRLGGRGGRLVEPDGRGRVVVGDRGRVLLGR